MFDGTRAKKTIIAPGVITSIFCKTVISQMAITKKSNWIIYLQIQRMLIPFCTFLLVNFEKLGTTVIWLQMKLLPMVPKNRNIFEKV